MRGSTLSRAGPPGESANRASCVAIATSPNSSETSSGPVERGRLAQPESSARMASLRTLQGTQRTSAPKGWSGGNEIRGCTEVGVTHAGGTGILPEGTSRVSGAGARRLAPPVAQRRARPGAARGTDRQLQLKKEPGPPPHPRFDLHRGAHGGDQLATDRESEPRLGEQLGGVLPPVHAADRIEQGRQDRRVDPLAAVADGERDAGG